MHKKLELIDLQSVRFSDWTGGRASDERTRYCFTTSGYEARSITWTARALEFAISRDRLTFYTVGFNDFQNVLSRPANDEFYKGADIEILPWGSSRESAYLVKCAEELSRIFDARETESIEIHVDYSCMPRRWYCALPEIIAPHLQPKDRAFFWYTPGKYEATSYPTAGTSDFVVFSGRPTLSSSSRTHLFGLGFDRIRSQAIWSVLDPHNLVCFYADPAADPSYVDRVERDNREALNAAAYTFKVPFNDFVTTYSKLVSMVSQFRSTGDVVIVPDGPKPLVLASSIVPMCMDHPAGVVCFHVRKRQTENFTPVDVPDLGEPVGFSFRGAGRDEQPHAKSIQA
jgi:hypothetical protein